MIHDSAGSASELFLRQARAQFGVEQLVGDRHALLKALGENTRTDIRGSKQVAAFVKLAVGALPMSARIEKAIFMREEWREDRDRWWLWNLTAGGGWVRNKTGAKPAQGEDAARPAMPLLAEVPR